MPRKVCLLPALMLASAALAAGCGGGDNKDDGGGGGGSSSSPRIRQAEAQCRSSVDQAQRLSSGVKDKLKKACGDAARGNREAVRQALRQVCVEIVTQNQSAGPSREQAKAACNQRNSP